MNQEIPTAEPTSIGKFLASRAASGSAQAARAPSLPTPAVDPVNVEHDSQATDAKVMIVDDASLTVRLMQKFLQDSGYTNFVTTSRSTEAMALLLAERPDVLLLDLNMPEVNGFDILAEMRAHPEVQHIPVLMLTAADDAATKLRALELGATDFLAKPVDTSELVLRLRNTLAAKAYQDRLTNYDAVTDLPNRSLLLQRLTDSLGQAERSGHIGAVLHVDLDRFRHLNESLGHRAGDRFLRSIARRVAGSVRTADDVCRGDVDGVFASASSLGGGEFVILLPVVSEQATAIQIAERIRVSISKPIAWEQSEFIVTPSIGIVIFPEHGDSAESLLRNASIATARAKQLGRNRCEVYSAQCELGATDQLRLETELHRALENNELQLHFQPKVCVASGRVIGAEALLRWQHPIRGLVSPAEFIPAAEETGLIVPFGSWVLREACEQLARWHDEAGCEDLSVAVNIASLQLKDGKLANVVREVLECTGINPHCLILELTESAIFENSDDTIEFLNALRALGVRLSLDDFGTGYSSLSYLEHLPIDELKIDRSFIAKIDAEGDEAPIVSAIVAMARNLGLKVVAEGVETEAQRAYLERHWCDVYQGYLFAKPLPPVAFVERLRVAARLTVKDDDSRTATSNELFDSHVVATPGDSENRRVLLIDDQRSVGELVAYMLAEDSVEVTIASTGSDGLALARAQPFDLVLLDVGLPDIDGFTVFDRLGAEANTRHLPVIFLTAKGTVEDESRGLNAGARDFICKPVHRDILRARVRNQLKQLRDRSDRGP